MQKQISNWRKELSITAETETVSDNGKLNRKKKKKSFRKYSVTNAREVGQLTETLKQKVQAKAQRIRRYKEREIQYNKNKIFKEDTKKLQKSGHEEYRGQRIYWKSLWREEAQHHERAKWIRKEKKKKISHMD